MTAPLSEHSNPDVMVLLRDVMESLPTKTKSESSWAAYSAEEPIPGSSASCR
jgi:hypothetical protein